MFTYFGFVVRGYRKEWNEKKTRTTIYNRPRIEEIERALYIFLYDRTMVMTKAPQPTLSGMIHGDLLLDSNYACAFSLFYFSCSPCRTCRSLYRDGNL